MKKIGYLILFLFTLVSCSSDDNSNKEVKTRTVETKLKLTASSTAVLVGEEVTFTTTNDKGETVDGSIVTDGYIIKANHAFDKPGKYTVKSIKKGYEQSNEVTISVDLSTLSLRINKTEVTAGEKVSFEVYSADKLVTENIKIYLEGQDKPLENNEFITKKEGEYTFIAKAEGYNDSEKVKLTVLEDMSPYGNYLILNDDKFELDRFNLDHNVITVDGKLVSEVFKTAQGELANLYTLIITNKANDKAKRSYIFIDLWVVNPTIKAAADGTIIDYGKRILPTNDAKVMVRSVYSSITGYEISDMFTSIKDVDFKIRNLDIEETGTKGKYTGKAEIMFRYSSDPENTKNTGKTIDFQFNGDTYIKEYLNDKVK
ncbi:hypothetical protein [Myroides sp. C4067]|uniref:hypothetical protein n=1 Tax=Myroides sp. C4067 TaxID=3136765 RepID=UPI0031015BC0